MKHFLLSFFLLIVTFASAQEEGLIKSNGNKETTEKNALPKAKYNQYRIISLQRDTTFVDTSLTIKKEYEYNYLRKDIFGLLPFANEGQTYTVLDFGLKNFSAFPEMGFSGKHFNYLQVNDIKLLSQTPTKLIFCVKKLRNFKEILIFIFLN